ncbi:CAP-associated domain-containing protein [Latilactobacillus sakei]|uniref:CAP-associated domain-containing protein n=1 Tax=Latilactobacillus sakei TaxID=1599 RepID=UPI00388B7D97
MKNLMRFVVALGAWLVLLYAWPIMHHVQPTVDSTQGQTKRHMKLTHPQNPLLKTQGPAKFINQPAAKLIAQYGQPVKQSAEDGLQSRWLFQLNSRHYIEATIDDQTGTTQQLVVIGQDNAIKPFKFGQSLKAITQETTIPANYELSLHEQKFQIELNETQQRQRPLIAFKNKTYAILVMQKGELATAVYLNANRLLQSNLYPVTSMTPVPVPEVVTGQSQQIDDERQLALLQYCQTLRLNAKLPELRSDVLLEADQLFLATLKDAPKTLLTDAGERRLKRAKQQRQMALPQKLTEADFTAKALEDYQLTNQQLFYFEQPVSVQQLIFERQTNPAFYQAIHNQVHRRIQIICTEGHTLVVIGE